ncbi:hypothetical protein C1Y11_24830 [Pseudomonas sp. FW305-20]|nr:hypothetical protein C1Y11_24830 [Pseudomonas sp. FW305-20]PMU15274.1 hypothetical protein C1Y10_23070 [Pseudomonas sp. FW305-122]PMU36922.1 hypothetical protein C1Y12_20995 [Pseudomonas sp. FW305-47B]PMX57292.1 hypothetical protein C1Y13_25050 [Pseudomonas sp. FW305-33]PMX69177.1 hypothetical protein C1X12_08305 [Pseudomonas sp. FW305-60]
MTASNRSFPRGATDRSHALGMQPGTLCVPFGSWNAERPLRHSHAERGNDQWNFSSLARDKPQA